MRWIFALFFSSGNADNTFSMDERQGIISVAKQLDRAVQPVFHLVTMATDHGLPPQSSTAEVKITVTVSDNAPPKFVHREIVTELKVCLKIKINLLEVKIVTNVLLGD